MSTALLLAFSFKGFIKGLILVVFILCALLLMLVILLQEPKGGGLSSAFGGAGAETFGVQTGGVNKFTSTVGGLFLLLAILYAAIRPDSAVAPSDSPDAAPDTAIGAPPEKPAETPPDKPAETPPEKPSEGEGATPPK